VPEALLRPGAAGGSYPERRDEPAGPVSHAVHLLHGEWVRRRAGRGGALRRFAAEVEARGAALEAASEQQLQRQTRELRVRLAGHGLGEPLLVESFALIREVARRTLGTPHYAVQLMGGWVLARGMLAEMETGEGKTLTATLPACTAALAGIPVHVISANDYLVERDAESMAPLYRALGLTVGTVTEQDNDDARRRAAYACDVTYGTAKTVAFDYLRDRLARGRERGDLAQRVRRLQGESDAEPLLLRGLCYAVVDEADSVLVDEARTPLILSGQADSEDHRRVYRRALRLARSLEEDEHFRLDRRERTARLTEAGDKRLEQLCQPLGGLWSGPRRRAEWVLRALSAEHLYLRDRDYIVRDDAVEIVDPLTGRPSADRSWEQGLHQLIELKERCPFTPEHETRARISYQQFFRRYLRVSGMTGTAREVARELWSVYGLATVRIATRLPGRRRDLGTRVFADSEARWRAVRDRVEALAREGRPVLVGTASVEASEHLSRLFADRGLPHQVLNARQDAEEAAVVARAGEPGRVTVATSMAGRGTDVKLPPGVADRGGLHVIVTQRAEAGRIDRQLHGRCARQGDPGSFEAILALEDEAVALSYPAPLRAWLRRWLPGQRPAPAWLGRLLTRIPQRAEEQRTARLRRALVHLEDGLGDLLAFSGPGE